MSMRKLGCWVVFVVLFSGCAAGVADDQKNSDSENMGPDSTRSEHSVKPSLIKGPEVTVDRAELVASLLAGRYEELDRVIGEAIAAAKRDVTWEANVSIALDAFETAAPGVEEALEGWVKSRSKSVPARLAYANHLSIRGWKARGQAFASETTDEQFASMRRFLERAQSEAKAALRLDPESIEARSILIGIRKGIPGTPRTEKLCQRALELRPATFTARVSCIWHLIPRWGGSYRAMEQYAQSAQEYADQNPKLEALLGYADWDRGITASNNEQYERAVELYSRALEARSFSMFYWDRARAYSRLSDYPSARKDLDRSLELWPQDPERLALRARIASILDDFEQAEVDYARAIAIDPEPGAYDFTRTYLAQQLARHALALAKTKDPEKLNRAQVALARAEAFDPREPRIFNSRALLLFKQGQPKEAEAEYLECLELDLAFDGCLKSLDWLLGKSQRWDEVAAHWDRFITNNPENASAYLERAGTHRRRRDMEAAYADLRTACDLGSDEACGILKRSGR